MISILLFFYIRIKGICIVQETNHILGDLLDLLARPLYSIKTFLFQLEMSLVKKRKERKLTCEITFFRKIGGRLKRGRPPAFLPVETRRSWRGSIILKGENYCITKIKTTTVADKCVRTNSY